ncbi:ribosomal-processing cysteine protease Prp [Alteribacter aurantiacus]|uniref:ribosomal-processing cysteine protease Prp n=1 Tax=Alteribacter aurantiacus TaxID=254410 RepID=UPI00040A8022|nr:ribosomal-processing cysteine protease Prp [Alteribacter aurantiacus]
MIRVSIERDENKHVSSFTMEGHADSGPHGHDLVCAAASALSFGTINAIAELCELELPVEMGSEGGFLSCRVPGDLGADTFEKVQLLLEGLVVSFRMLEEQYGEYIQISRR